MPGRSSATLGSMSNNVSVALYLSGVVLVVGYALAAPAAFILHRSGTLNARWLFTALPLAIAAWWCAYLFGLGAQSPFNVQELFILAATYVVAAYTALIFNRRFPRPEALPGIFVAVCLTAVFLLRVLTPTIGE